jgi:hypothetical protein
MRCARGRAGVFRCARAGGAVFSGFNSRLRKGQPLLHNEWTAGEATAFARFPTPNTLAEALSSGDAATLAAATDAMVQIGHVNAPLARTLGSPEQVAARAADIVWIAFTETLVSDFEVVRGRLNLPDGLALPTDNLRAHRTPAGFSTELSALGQRNIEGWYAADRAFLDRLRMMRETLRPAR